MFDEPVIGIFNRQRGLITRAQAKEAGMSDGRIRSRLNSGMWNRVHYGLYRHHAVERSWYADIWLGVLATGGVAGHRTAARLHGIEGMPMLTPEIVVPQGCHRPIDHVMLHQSTQVDSLDLTEIRWIPCTGLARTVLDLGAVLTEKELGRVVDSLLRVRRLDEERLRSVLARHARCGRDGSGRLRQVLDVRFGDDAIALSDWSYRVAELLQNAGLRRPRFEFRVHSDDGIFLAQVDLAYPHARLAIELDSVRHHGDYESFGRDRSRVRLLTVDGWRVLSFTWADFVKRPDQLVSQVSSALSS